MILKISNSVSLTSATSFDNDSDGYLDGYDLYFSKAFLNSNFDIANVRTNLQIGTGSNADFVYSLTGNAETDDTVRLLFNTGAHILASGARPTVSLSTFTNTDTFTTSSPTGSDGAAPRVWSINGGSIASFTGITDSGSIVVGFSESMKTPETLSGFTMSGVAGSPSLSAGSTMLTFTASTFFPLGDNSFTLS